MGASLSVSTSMALPRTVRPAAERWPPVTALPPMHCAPATAFAALSPRTSVVGSLMSSRTAAAMSTVIDVGVVRVPVEGSGTGSGIGRGSGGTATGTGSAGSGTVTVAVWSCGGSGIWSSGSGMPSDARLPIPRSAT